MVSHEILLQWEEGGKIYFSVDGELLGKHYTLKECLSSIEKRVPLMNIWKDLE